MESFKKEYFERKSTAWILCACHGISSETFLWGRGKDDDIVFCVHSCPSTCSMDRCIKKAS